jgi:nicotinamide riboside transporter PnuC
MILRKKVYFVTNDLFINFVFRIINFLLYFTLNHQSHGIFSDQRKTIYP